MAEMQSTAAATATAAQGQTGVLDVEPLAKVPEHEGTLVPEGGHASASAFGFDAAGWVGIAGIIVILLMIWKKVPAAIGGSLDKRIAEIKAQLAEAQKLREEAEALRSEYEGRAKAAEADAQAMREHAHEEARQIVEQAKEDAAQLVARRKQMAEDRIAAAERQAVAEVRERAAGAAVTAARAIIGERFDAEADSALIARSIEGLGRTH
ncbi:F0F1 ATP synthase subunit B [Stakelama pacifica]|uniref:ATP synthase subunit b n=1 Tax=Stakelama pacifica TaxID=517720 RepID=A0A4R6FPY2_9SPHN|nr:F0F1 ATP synthase subunit B [Stakelama pacifica]TDN83683.1 F-type H+-transporting ATPase subunit b [Stakelama pacifica]GGO94513.1 hypothetical protein GCM10011329_16570 [Stakelama pacifica]